MQCGGMETVLRPERREKTVTEEAKMPAVSAAKADEGTTVTNVSRYFEHRELHGMTAAEMSDVFERDARRYDG